MNPLAIRPATPADIPTLHALVEAAYRGDSARTGWTHEADLLGGQRTDRGALAAMIAAPDERILLAIDPAGALAGCVRVEQVAPDRCYLGLLSVDPARQAGGIGRALIDAAEACARTTFGAGWMEMTVIRQRTELIAWYERRGYRLTGEARPFPLDDPRFGLPKTRDLEFVVLKKGLNV